MHIGTHTWGFLLKKQKSIIISCDFEMEIVSLQQD